MKRQRLVTDAAELSLEASAWIAGLGLMAMTIFGTIALFYLLPMGTVAGDGAATLLALKQNGDAFILGGAFLMIVYVLDIVVAWALHWFLRAGNLALSQLAAWLRLSYVFFAVIGLMSSAEMYGLAHNPELIEHLGIEALETQILLNLTRAETISTMAFLFFGVHLIVLGIAIWHSRHAPIWLGIVVVLAGLSYVVINAASFVAPEAGLDWLIPFAMGEAVLMVWLLFSSARQAFRASALSKPNSLYGYIS
ncbi:MAG: DUF4386 domain-containing protein [Henriciella sp.]